MQFLPPPGKRQTLLFSATWAEGVEQLSNRVQRTPEIVSDGAVSGAEGGGGGESSSSSSSSSPPSSSSRPAAAQVDRELLRQSAVLFAGGNRARLDALCHVLEGTQSTPTRGAKRGTGAGAGAGAGADAGAEAEPSCLVFCETREQCKEVAGFLTSRGASASAMHGELEQSEREKVLI